jgi:superfamily II DNA/RNA helicase
MPLKQREEVIGGLGNGKIQVLTSVDVISEGTDCPNVSVAILLRATKSEGLYLQQVGRILRPQENKTAIILDHVNATRTHGFVDDDRKWSLDSEKKKRKKGENAPRVETCKKCFAAYKPAPKCPVCGYEAQQREARFIKEEEGELIELKKQQEKESIKQQQKLLIASAKTMEELEMVAKILGYKKGWAYRVFQSRKLKPKKDYDITKANLEFSVKSSIAKLFVQNQQAFKLFVRLFSPASKKDDHIRGMDFVSKVDIIFTHINQNRPYKNKALDMKNFIEMAKYSWDIAFITNYVNNSMKFRDDLVR